YNIMTDEDVNYAVGLAEEIDTKITSMMRRALIAPGQAEALAILEYADSVKKLQTENEALKVQLKEYLADAAQAKSERDILKREIAKLKKNGRSEV
ncbi:MAG: hypothetical protein LUH40_05275, partial [Clostridiales bacterium]|nr:hypothetical protein [Clostridiales bacterium]